MRILVTGARGHLGSALVPRLEGDGHVVTSADLPSLDLSTGSGLKGALAGQEAVVHLPALHGKPVAGAGEADFWDLNVSGLQRTLDAMRRLGVRRMIFLSSQAVHDSTGIYGFTKSIGEQLLDYQHREHGLAYVAVRPHNFTPWADWGQGYGARLLYDGVDLVDVVGAVRAAIRHLESNESSADVLDATRAPGFSERDLDGWEDDPVGHAELIAPGARRVVERLSLDISRRPWVTTTEGWAEVGFRAEVNFATFVARAIARFSGD